MRHAAALVALALAACAPAAPAGPTVAAASPRAALTSGTALERFFPLVDGRVHAWATTNDRGEAGVLTARVHRADGATGELRFPANARRFRYEPDGVVTISRLGASSYVLKEPLALGATWPGEHGGTTKITAVDASVETPAGRFAGCVVAEERTGGPTPVRYASTFCPGAGLVVLAVESGPSFERATLTSYGEPVSIEGEGLRRLP